MKSAINDPSTGLQLLYKHRFHGNSRYRDDVWKILCHDFFAKYIESNSVLLDLGAGGGEFSRNIVAKKKLAMDLNPDCGKSMPEDCIFLQQDCSTTWLVKDATLDIVFTSNFLEHLQHKELVEFTLREAFRCLKQGGKIICLGPNIKHIPGAYWDYWDHFTPITEESMAELLSLIGFSVTKKIDRFLPYTMSQGIKPPLVALKLYLKLPLAWRFFGKQFLIIAHKP